MSGAPAAEAVHVFVTDQAGRANGASGNAYAIPFRDGNCQLLPLKLISAYIKDLRKYEFCWRAQRCCE